MKGEKHLGRELRALDHQVKRYVESQMNQATINRLTDSNGWIIGWLMDQREAGREVYQKDLEANFHITRSTVSKVLNLMEEKGLLKRESVPGDARLKRLTLTPMAVELSQEMKARLNKVEGQITKGFSKEELEQFYSYMERIRKNVTEEV